ncbi:MAG: hypothetical protein R6W06_09965 [Prochlorococcaceae cyanobacterium]
MGYSFDAAMFLIHSSLDQAPLLAGAVVGACRGDGWLTPLQPRFLGVLFEQLLGYRADFNQLSPLAPEEVLQALPTAEQRLELVELMVMLEMLCDAIPEELEDSIEHWAAVLGVEDRSLQLARVLAAHASAQALHDFYRYNWIGEQDKLSPAFEGLLARHGEKAYALTVEPDPDEAARWRALEHCPAGSIGRTLWDFYQERGFGFPGEPGAANAALAHHDWIHVLGEFDTTPMGEMEVTAFQGAASSLPGATLGFIGAVSIFQTGLLPSVVVPPGYSHALEVPGGPERIADAIRRGRSCQRDVFREIDFFAVSAEPLLSLRERWRVPEKAPIPQG